MVPRYSRPAMVAIWSPEERFRIWFEIEALAAEAMAGLGTIPAGTPVRAVISDPQAAVVLAGSRVHGH